MALPHIQKAIHKISIAFFISVIICVFSVPDSNRDCAEKWAVRSFNSLKLHNFRELNPQSCTTLGILIIFVGKIRDYDTP